MTETAVPGRRDTEPAVPLVDLGPVHGPIKSRLLAAIGELIDTGAFTNGPQVQAFEAAFARHCGAVASAGVGSGLDALRLSLLAIGIGPGDEIVVPANTFVATIEAVRQAGATPILVDVGLDDYNVDAAAAEAAVSTRARAILPVHLYGQLADMRRLAEVASRHGLALIEDACQAHGAARDGVRPGLLSRAACFSFYPGKNLGAMGDAGAVISDDAELVARVRALREHGQTVKYRHELEGYTARLDSIQAVVLLEKLPFLDRWTQARAQAARFYDEALDGVGDLVLPPVPAGSMPAWHLYVVRTAEPESLVAFLSRCGVATGRHYPHPVHLSPAHSWLAHGAGSFPVSEALCRELLSLPLYPGITEIQQDRVAEAVRDYFAHGR